MKFSPLISINARSASFDCNRKKSRIELKSKRINKAVERATYIISSVDVGNGRDRLDRCAHALVPRVLGFVRAYDGPARAIVDDLFVALAQTRRCLELNDAILRQAQVHAIGVLQVEGALVQLRDRIDRVQDHLGFVHFANNLLKQSVN